MDKLNIVISPMTKSDVEQVNSFENKFEHRTISMDSLLYDLENENYIYLCAKIDDKVIGYGGFSSLIDHADISVVAVSKDYQNKGIGRYILSNLIDCIKDKRIFKVFLEVRASNIYAIKLYERFGFCKINIRKNYYTNEDGTKEDAIIYMLDLK